jgi:predicted alpha/beta-hydrolase family hydrolase
VGPPELVSTLNEIELAAQPCLVLRPRAARAMYVLAHGAGAGMRHAFMNSLAEQLAERGIATLRYEFPYLRAGRAMPGKPELAEANVQTIWAAAAQRYPNLPRFAGGKSYGARMTSRAHAANPLAGVRGLIFLGYPLHPPGKPSIERVAHLPHASGPLLFLTGSRDELAELELLRPVVQRLGARAELTILEGADHGFTRPKAAVGTLADLATRWIDRELADVDRNLDS